MLVTIPLTGDERAAVEDGAEGVERLLDPLTHNPPAAPSRRSLTP